PLLVGAQGGGYVRLPSESARERQRAFDGLAGALAEIGGLRLGGVAEEGYAAAAPRGRRGPVTNAGRDEGLLVRGGDQRLEGTVPAAVDLQQLRTARNPGGSVVARVVDRRRPIRAPHGQRRVPESGAEAECGASDAGRHR